MAEIKYVRCGSGCKHEAYDKKEVDKLLADKASIEEVYFMDELYSKDEISSMFYTIEGVTTEVSEFINYPEGFNKDNCVVLSFMTSVNNNNAWSNIALKGDYGVSCRVVLGDNILINNVDLNADSIHYKLVLFKVPQGV